ncbi:MAG: FAD-binding oxidoreductase [Actinobacteria bacterium]|nr:FAD-binding oxidoreductase [Actinomycetota bacterium]
MGRERSWWGWGYEDEHLTGEALEGLGAEVARRLDTEVAVRAPADIGDLDLPSSRVNVPDALAAIADATPRGRAVHAHGNSFRDVVGAFEGTLEHYPDVVVRPRTAEEVVATLEWCSEAQIACVPFGGGTSVVGGVTPTGDLDAVVSLDLGALDRVVEVDTVSRAARIQAGALGPVIENQLRPHDLTLRHFPQSWEFSTLGGWLATRAGGHFATLATHIDDLVESITAITPSGEWVSRRLPGSGAGPSPDRLLLGSEGTLGVITEAWMRVQPRPTFRSQASVQFPDFASGADAVRDLAQSGLYPANCRLLDPTEAALSGAGDGAVAVLVLGFESDDHPLHAWIDRAVELCRDRGGTVSGEVRHREGDTTGTSEGSAGSWRGTFLRAPYLRDALVALGVVVETVETAITWDRFHRFVAEVDDAVRRAATEVCGAAVISCRLTHAYPDGAAPYFTVIAPGESGARVAQWDTIKEAASEAILAQGGTITHHHAVGRDHVPWYVRQRPDPFGAALAAAKRAVDPAAILNPGVLGL